MRLTRWIFWDWNFIYIVQDAFVSIEINLNPSLLFGIRITHFVSDKIYFDLAQKKPKIILEGHSYLLYRKLTQKTVWLCSGYYTRTPSRCKAKVETCGKVATIMGYHIHPQTVSREKYERMTAQDIVICRDPRDDVWKLRDQFRDNLANNIWNNTC